VVLTVSTINVNGVRAAAGKGFLAWLAATDADVVCVQETRATLDQLPAAVRTPDGWHAAFAEAADKGRNGVGILTREPPGEVRQGFGVAEFDTSGRYLEVTLPGLVVGSLYLPSGDVGTTRQEEKWRFLAGFLPYLADLREKAAADGREVLICGDWNIAHTELDLKAWRTNQRNSGFLPEERAWLSELFGETGYVDVTRSLHPGMAGPYSWWSYRGKAFDNDAGWRIDLHVATRGLAERAESSVVERAATYAERWSDHAPVTVRYRS
jgi:exodeoxyribonuclease-3